VVSVRFQPLRPAILQDRGRPMPHVESLSLTNRRRRRRLALSASERLPSCGFATDIEDQRGIEPAWSSNESPKAVQ
jgi:hypothetical protein